MRIAIVNLCEDPVPEAALHLPPHWKAAGKVRLLNRQGRWQECPVERTADGLTVKKRLDCLTPLYLLFSKE